MPWALYRWSRLFFGRCPAYALSSGQAEMPIISIPLGQAYMGLISAEFFHSHSHSGQDDDRRCWCCICCISTYWLRGLAAHISAASFVLYVVCIWSYFIKVTSSGESSAIQMLMGNIVGGVDWKCVGVVYYVCRAAFVVIDVVVLYIRAAWIE